MHMEKILSRGKPVARFRTAVQVPKCKVHIWEGKTEAYIIQFS